MTVDAVHRQNVIGIAHSFQIHQQRRITQPPQGHGSEQRAFHAMRHALAQNHAG